MAYRRLDQILREKGQISDEQITKALHQQTLRGGRLGEHLLSNGDINESELVEALSEQLHIRGVSITNRTIDPQLFEHLPRAVAEHNLCVPIAFDPDENMLTVAFADPLDREVVRAVERAIRPIRLRPRVGLATQIHAALTTNPPDGDTDSDADDSELAGCLDLFDLAMSNQAIDTCSAMGWRVDATRLIREVSERLGVDTDETNHLRMASLALDIISGKSRVSDSRAELMQTASALLQGVGLVQAAVIVDQTLNATLLNDPPHRASQILLTCRALVDELGNDSLTEFNLDDWKTNFCSRPGFRLETAIVDQVIDVMRARYVRERLFTPAGELLLIGENDLAASVVRAARGRGLRVVRSSNLNDAVDSTKRRRPDLVCYFIPQDVTDDDGNLGQRIASLGIPLESVLVVAPSELANQLESDVPNLLTLHEDSTTADTLVKRLMEMFGHARHGEHTVPAASPSDHADDVVITGRLADLGTADLIQVLSTAQKTVRVDFTNEHHTATLWFHSGRIMRAESDVGVAEIAFYQLIGWSDGRFEVRTLTDLPGTNISTATTALLLEALRRIDEQNSVSRSIHA
ncbi:MAG: DUF4388 domain-containing protein [candidate division Zixibacteria bacterium]|nr:DUF4388 domain-containing protein [candidate division Zixibacteria bacterium]